MYGNLQSNSNSAIISSNTLLRREGEIMKLKHFLLWAVFILILTACDGKNSVPNETMPVDDVEESEKEIEFEAENEAEKQAVAEDTEPAPLPQTLAELAALPPGYTGPQLFGIHEEDHPKLDELTAHLPDISGEPTEAQLDHYYNEILAIFQHDFKGPEELLAKMRFQAIGNPDIEDPRMHFKENLNVLILLDASGSMGKDLGGETQMAAAKNAITNFVEGLPAEANVGLRIYGHEGTGNVNDKARSCASSDLIYPIGKYDKADFQTSLKKAQPAGWTPIQLAINEAQEDLAQFKGDQNTNIVYLVSDGVSTCDDDPVEAAKQLYNSDITPIVNVIGFNVDNEGQKQLKEVAKATEGTYEDVQNAESLQNELDQMKEVAKSWEKWKEQKTTSLEHDKLKNSLDIFGYETDEYKKRVDEGSQVGTALQYLYQQRKLMSRESHDYLRKRNGEYHNWIEEEYNKLKKELKELNEKKIDEALQLLEEKYIQNVPRDS
ncbi:VWA domain-containing protein [Sporosarcina sp. ACRSM]|uniref:VWA domain-containing protein n=1 Tax=Sporosarcina sp. ACRSM TaxID=2918216 RepID=UPI001EF3FC24|nr:VWA domain-containing protein [Sporosarcina sp. ACRSM]MCG7337039.1 VWA domain-containing protein [Sporosarcina sp. ACRSM]